MSDHLNRAHEFSRRLVEIYGDELVAVGLYGSAARGEFREASSDLNVLVILRDLDAERLRRGSSLAREWVENGNPPPLMFSEEEWRGSADAFPIEYTDIADSHIVLHGSDIFAGIDVRWEDLRLICEHELKSKKIALRERYLLAAETPAELGMLLTSSISTFVALFRAMHRLSGTKPPADSREVILQLARTAAFDPDPFLNVLAARDGGTPLTPAADDPAATGYLSGITRVSDWLDGLSGPPAGGTGTL
jgi:predicted nucleotidyltransferase